MRISSWSLPAIMVLAESGHVSAKAVISPGLLPQSNTELEDLMDGTPFHLVQRSPQATSTSSSVVPTASSGTLGIGDRIQDNNMTITTACTAALANITNVLNGAGFTGCYNVLQWSNTTAKFEADLRIFATGQTKGSFSNVAEDMILALLDFPSATTFKSLTKRTNSGITRRQSTGSLIQQYRLQGGFSGPIDFTKLNTTQIASLMVPQITLQATINGSTFKSNMTTADMALFATGMFTQLSASAAEVANPRTAQAAIAKAKIFVLPGTTFGIFPIGFIVTSAWTVMFVLMYAAGTIARYRYRNLYRKRAAAISGMANYRRPGVGKF